MINGLKLDYKERTYINGVNLDDKSVRELINGLCLDYKTQWEQEVLV